jgi:CDP-diacylglycerol---serine O-phosphatidyltransferase
MSKKISRHIPNSLTLFNIGVGLAAIMLTASGEYVKAAGLIIVSVIIDSFDGYVARLLKSTSRLGGYLDTISDYIAFGIATPYLMLRVYHIPLWLALLYCLSSGYRLIYFMRTKNTAYFFGLPTTPAAGFLATLILLSPGIALQAWPMMTLILSALMVSRIKYYRIELKNRKTITLISSIFLSLFVLDPILSIWALMFIFLAYILLGWLKITEKNR